MNEVVDTTMNQAVALKTPYRQCFNKATAEERESAQKCRKPCCCVNFAKFIKQTNLITFKFNCEDIINLFLEIS